jgi:hypothetical protein
MFLSDIAKEFRYIKNAWRNHAMHAHTKYTMAEARSIFQHVGGLMKALYKASLVEERENYDGSDEYYDGINGELQ